MNFADGQHLLAETFLLFVLIVFVHALINIFQTHLVARPEQRVRWGACRRRGSDHRDPGVVPDTHQSADFVFTERINNSGFGDGMYWFYILPPASC